jgi:hypothetical protein
LGFRRTTVDMFNYFTILTACLGVVDRGVPTNIFRVGVSTNSVEDIGQSEPGSGGGSPLVRGSTQFANELTLSLLMSYMYGAPCKARNFKVVYIWTYVWQR